MEDAQMLARPRRAKLLCPLPELVDMALLVADRAADGIANPMRKCVLRQRRQCLQLKGIAVGFSAWSGPLGPQGLWLDLDDPHHVGVRPEQPIERRQVDRAGTEPRRLEGSAADQLVPLHSDFDRLQRTGCTVSSQEARGKSIPPSSRVE
jgi:hypothetical protein